MGQVAQSRAKTRQQIVDLQSCLEYVTENGLCEALKERLVHHFAPGLYIREFHMNAGDVVVGKIHKYAHANTLAKGKVVVTTEYGGRETIEAPAVFVSQPGTKRAVHALEDTVWVTYHPTDKTDPEEIEKDVIADSFEEFEEHICYEQKKVLENKQ